MSEVTLLKKPLIKKSLWKNKKWGQVSEVEAGGSHVRGQPQQDPISK